MKMKTVRIKAREKKHFSSKKIEWLKVLEDDGSFYRKKILEQSLAMWDRDLNFIAPSLYAGKNVLDAGCGNLRYTSFLKSRGAGFVIGGDISMDFIKTGLGKKHFFVYDSKISAKPDACLQLDCEYAPFKRASFDSVFFFHSIHHMPDKNKVLQESRRILKSGGNLIIADLNGSHPLRKIADKIGKSMGVMSIDEKSLRPDDMIRALRKNGFEVNEIHYMNMFSELAFHGLNIIGNSFPRLSLLLKGSLFALNAIDRAMEKTLLKITPSLSWRYLIIATKV